MPSNDAWPVTSDARLVARFQTVSKIAGTSAIVIGATVLAGWALGIRILESAVPNQITMKANTAVAFVLCGAALLCMCSEPAGTFRQRFGQACALLGTLIGVLSLIEYVLQVNLGIDLLLFHEGPGAVGTVSPGRMAPFSAVNFVLIGIALLLLSIGGSRCIRGSQALALIALTASLIPGLEYLFGIVAFSELAALTHMAVPATAGFVIVSTGVLLARPDCGFVRVASTSTQGGLMLRRLLPAALLIPVVLGWLRLQGERAHYYESAAGTLAMVAVLVMVLGSLVWFYANSLDASDAGRRRAEEALRQGESRYRLLLESLPQKIAYKDRNSVYISCNENYARDLNMKPEQIAGHTDYDFFTKELAEKYRADDHSVMESGEPRLVEESYVQNGTELWVNTIKAPVRDDSGKVTGVFVLFWEITERKRAEEAMRAASLYTRNLIEVSLDPLVTISSAGKITDVNQATEAATGVPREKLIGSDFSDYFTEPDKAREGYQRVFEQGIVRDYPLALRHVSGRITDVLYNATVYRNEAGEVQGIFAAARDITERKNAEERLREASLYARRLIEASPDPLVTISSDGKITDANRGAELVTGVPRERLVGSDFSNYFTEPESARKGYQEVFQQGTIRDYPLAIRHTSGRITDVLYNASVYKNEAGEVQGVFAAARDVTARKAAEAALEQKAQELTRSNEELAQFAYVASHDLQEPLRKIVAFGDRLVAHVESALDEQGRDYLQRMQNAAKRMGQLIESLLELSRITTKGAQFAAVDLNAVLAEVLADLEVRIQQTAGRVDLEPLPTVTADRSQMRQLFQNLIGNALKFHQENVPPVIRVYAEYRDEAWEIHVADNGIGFDEKYADRIFRPFQRLHGKNVFEGSGMGLAICNKIVARHAGEITAHSQPGRGSDFVLTLPAMPKTREASAS